MLSELSCFLADVLLVKLGNISASTNINILLYGLERNGYSQSKVLAVLTSGNFISFNMFFEERRCNLIWLM